jgi:hypothetical protein
LFGLERKGVKELPDVRGSEQSSPRSETLLGPLSSCMSDLLISIIIPCFNAEKYAGEAIESALAQTWPNKEVIVIDDGSMDDSLAVIKSFGNRIRWETGSNRGASAARNQGIRLARGEYVQFLDADDVLCPGKIERQLQVMGERRVDAVLCDSEEICGTTGKMLGTRRIVWDGKDPFELLLHLRPPVYISSALHHRKWFHSGIMFNESLPCCQDLDLHLKLACAGASFCHIPEVLFSVRRVAQSLSRSSYLRVLDQHEGIIMPLFGELRRAGKMNEKRAMVFASLMSRDARHYLQLGEIDKGKEQFRRARQMHDGGGLHTFSRSYRLLFRLIGPVATERLSKAVHAHAS